MAWFTYGTSIAERWCPEFEVINRDPAYKYPGLETGHPLTETTVPPIGSVHKSARLKTRHKHIPDAFVVAGNLCVRSRVKLIVESVEPNCHQFFPIELFFKKGERIDGDFYLLNICTLLSSIIPEQSDFDKIFREYGEGDERKTFEFWMPRSRVGQPDHQVLQRSIVAGKHLWRESLTTNRLYFSDELHEFFEREKIQKLNEWHYATEQ